MENIDLTAFSNNLYTLIESRGMTTQSLSEQTEIPAPTLSRYLHKARTPSIEYVICLAKFFNVSLSWLLGLDAADSSFDVTVSNIKDVVRRYSIASPDDQRIIRAILSKYSAEATEQVSGEEKHDTVEE